MIMRIKKEYEKMSIVAKASIWFVFCTLLQKGVAFITVPIFTRIMPTVEYGLYSTYLSWYAIITVICTLDMHNCIYMNQISKTDNIEEKDKVAVPMLSLSNTIVVVLLLVYLCFHKTINLLIKLPTSIVVLLFFQVFFDSIINFWLIRQRFEYNYKNIIIKTIIIVFLNAFLGIFFVMLVNKNQAVARVISIVLVQVIFGLILYIQLFKKTGRFFSANGWKKILYIQLPLLPHALSLTILSSVDRIMINSFVGATETAIYGVAYSSAYVVNVLKNSIVDAARPDIYKSIKEGKYEKIDSMFKNISIFIILILILFIVFAPEIIRIMAPNNYYNAIYIIPPVATSTLFTFLYCMYACISFYYEKTRQIMYASVASAILNLILNWIFIPIYGYIAAGYTTLVCYIFLAIFHYFIMKNIVKKELHNIRIFDDKFTIFISLVMLIIMIVLTKLYEYILIRYSVVLICLIIMFVKRKKIVDVFKKIKK